MRTCITDRLRWAKKHLVESFDSAWCAAVLAMPGGVVELIDPEAVPDELRGTLCGDDVAALLRGAPRSPEPITVELDAPFASPERSTCRLMAVPIVGEIGLLGAFFLPMPDGAGLRSVAGPARLAGTVLLDAIVRVSAQALVRAQALHETGRPLGSLVSFDEQDRVLFAHAGATEGDWPTLSSVIECMQAAADAPGDIYMWEEVPEGGGGLLRIEHADPTPWERDTDRFLGLALRVINLSEQLLVSSRVPEGPLLENAEAARRIAEEAMSAADADALEARLDLGPILDESREWFEPVLRADGLQVITLGGVELPLIRGNRFALRHVFRILIDRVRRTRKGRSGIVSCRTWSEADHVLIAVSDNGKGISRERPLYEHWPGTEPDPDPHGLEALKRLIEPLDGKLEVESRPRIWTRFVIRFPITHRKSKEISDSLASAIQVTEEDPRGLEVLVVDDNQQIRDVLRRFLIRLGHKVTLAEDGEGALELIGSQPFDKVLLDVNMPGQDGPTFYRSLDATAPELMRRTIFMTGGVVEEEINGFIRDTGCPRLGKPFMLDELVQVLEA